MKIALIRREYITHLDGVNMFIALSGGLREAESKIAKAWCSIVNGLTYIDAD